MTKHILILVHVEDDFRSFFPEDYEDTLLEAMTHRDCIEVWHMTSHIMNDHPVWPICEYSKNFDWSWGYEPDMFDENDTERKYLISSYGHEWTYITPELRKELPCAAKQYEIHLGGGYDGECLTDFESVLDYLKIDYTKRRELVY